MNDYSMYPYIPAGAVSLSGPPPRLLDPFIDPVVPVALAMLGSMQTLERAEIHVDKKVSVEIAPYTWLSSHGNLTAAAAYIVENRHAAPEPPQSAYQTGDAESGSQPHTRAASRSGTARVQFIPDNAELHAVFSARKSYMKTQGMNISAVHPFDADEPDHLLTATGLLWTPNATTKSSIGKVFAAPLKTTRAAQDFIYRHFVGKYACGPILNGLTSTLYGSHLEQLLLINLFNRIAQERPEIHALIQDLLARTIRSRQDLISFMPTYQGLSVCRNVLEHAPPDMINADLAHQVLQSLRTSLASPALAPHVSTALDKILTDFIGERRPCMTSLFLRMTSALPNSPPPPLARMTSALPAQLAPPPPHLLASTVNPPPEAAPLADPEDTPTAFMARTTGRPDSTSRGPSRGPSERWDRVAPPQDKENARLRRRIAQLEAERDEPRERRRDAERDEPRDRRRPASYVATTAAAEDSEVSDSDHGPRPRAYTALIADPAGSP